MLHIVDVTISTHTQSERVTSVCSPSPCSLFVHPASSGRLALYQEEKRPGTARQERDQYQHGEQAVSWLREQETRGSVSVGGWGQWEANRTLLKKPVL